jgi:hypothetical protein
MGWIGNILGELWSLFVDDFALAATAALWVLAVALGVRFGLPPGVAGPLLFIGLAAALAFSVWRAPGRKG